MEVKNLNLKIINNSLESGTKKSGKYETLKKNPKIGS